MSKRALMIADADGLWCQRFIEHILLPDGYEVTLFPIWGTKGKFADFYQRNGVRVYEDRHTLPVIRYIPRVRMWARVALNARDLKALGPFDVIHNHYLSQRDLALGQAVARAFPNAKWVCTFWGSDVLRATPKRLAEMQPYLRRCRSVNVTSVIQRDAMARVYGAEILEKTRIIPFGQVGLSAIDKVRAVADKAACKVRMGIAPERKVVCIGYSASPAQQQDKALRAMAALPEDVQREITVLLQMSYGQRDENYEREIRDAADALQCDTRILTDFLNDEQSAYLRLCADAFVMPIVTDAFSGSMQEYLYAGAQTLVGRWLVYPQLDELGIEPIWFSDFAELPAKLEQALHSELTGQERACRDRIAQKYTWEALRPLWLAEYE